METITLPRLVLCSACNNPPRIKLYWHDSSGRKLATGVCEKCYERTVNRETRELFYHGPVRKGTRE